MYIWMYMKAAKRVSIAQTRSELPKLLDEAARGRPIEVTRRGAPVAAIVSLDDYARLRGGADDFWTRLQRFRAGMSGEDLSLDLRGVRQRDRGRRVRL